MSKGPEEGGFRITQILSILGFRRVHTLIVGTPLFDLRSSAEHDWRGLSVRVLPSMGLERRTQAGRNLSSDELLSRLPR